MLDHCYFLGCVALVAQQPIVVKLSLGQSVSPYIRVSVSRSVSLSSALWKNGGSDPYAIVGWTDPSMRQIVGFVDRSTRRGTFGGEFGVHHCNQWGIFGVHVLQRHDMALFPN